MVKCAGLFGRTRFLVSSCRFYRGFCRQMLPHVRGKSDEDSGKDLIIGDKRITYLTCIPDENDFW